mmetsp:Transcript_16297/g.15743  ORF Transcript_16297/g.15743 Transcript_16297/m.15743 type:complete len:85 (+) Transcript_16297:475-729(+)
MAKCYHGNPPNHLAQIMLLCNVSYSYRELYEGYTKVATKKTDNNTSVLKLKLKRRYCRDLLLRTCHSGVDITSLDLEKKNRSTS